MKYYECEITYSIPWFYFVIWSTQSLCFEVIPLHWKARKRVVVWPKVHVLKHARGLQKHARGLQKHVKWKLFFGRKRPNRNQKAKLIFVAKQEKILELFGLQEANLATLVVNLSKCPQSSLLVKYQANGLFKSLIKFECLWSYTVNPSV